MGILGAYAGIGDLNHFDPVRFEDFLNRRGWMSVLWERSSKCPCYSADTGSPDPNDPRCNGQGYVWFQDYTMEVRYEQLTIEQPSQATYYLKCSFNGIMDPTRVAANVVVKNVSTNVIYTVSTPVNNQITISGGTLPTMWDKLVASYTYQRAPADTVRAVMTSVDYQKDFIPTGEWLRGDMIMTVSGIYKMGFRDRITIPEMIVRADELKTYLAVDAKSRSLELLRYKTGIEVLLANDKYQTFVLNTDFSIGSNALIQWLSGGLKPMHQAISIQYAGNATSALMTVNSTGLTVTLAGQTDGSQSLNLLFSDYPTVTALLAAISAAQGYTATQCEDSARAGINGCENTTLCVPIAAQSILAPVIIYNNDKTQYTISYVHQATFTIFQDPTTSRRPDGGRILPTKYWLRLWENTDLFSNTND